MDRRIKDFFDAEKDKLAKVKKAIETASGLKVVSHNFKFTHPDVKSTAVLSNKKEKMDGFVKTGNTEQMLDIVANSPLINLTTFLVLDCENNKTIYENILNDEPRVKTDFTELGLPFEDLKKKLETFVRLANNESTSDLLKQVYFPVGQEYHLLSILTSSALVFTVKKRLKAFVDWESIKDKVHLRSRGEYSEHGFEEIYNLTKIKYGGDHPRNIGAQNHIHYGTYFLLPSLPPEINERKVRLPKANFFYQSLYQKSFNELLDSLHKIRTKPQQNMRDKNHEEAVIRKIVDRVVLKSWKLRQQEYGWSDREYFANLPEHQKIWLDDSRSEDRFEKTDWIESVIHDLLRWLSSVYRNNKGRKNNTIDEDEFIYYKNIIGKNKEAFL
ncbi:MAG: type I-F CRISPR-associated protein Csy1 [Spirochaetia bacterium]